jgi:ribosome-binding factor A
MKNSYDNKSKASSRTASSSNGTSLHGAKPKAAANHRTQRVEREIREVVGSYLISGFRGELHGVVSVSRVIASKDLRSAKILVTVMGGESERKATVASLRAYAHEVQHEINRRLQMKFCPKINFLYDDGFDNVMRVEKILQDLSEERARAELALKAANPQIQPATDLEADPDANLAGPARSATSDEPSR